MYVHVHTTYITCMYMYIDRYYMYVHVHTTYMYVCINLYSAIIMHKDIQWRFTIMRNKIRNHHYAFRLQINWQYVHELHNLI